MKYLGIDYGRKHIGLAISNGIFAEPYNYQLKIPIFQKKGKKPSLRKRELFAKKIKIIEDIIKKEKIDKIVIGISEGKMAEETRRFAETIEEITGVFVEYYDETLTSQEAVKKMIEAKKKKKFRQEKEHNIAACIILQEYLNSVGES